MLTEARRGGPDTVGIGAVDDRDQLLERLRNLRTILPAFGQELASARRQAARLRIENARLVEEVARLHRERASTRAPPSS